MPFRSFPAKLHRTPPGSTTNTPQPAAQSTNPGDKTADPPSAAKSPAYARHQPHAYGYAGRSEPHAQPIDDRHWRRRAHLLHLRTKSPAAYPTAKNPRPATTSADAAPPSAAADE